MFSAGEFVPSKWKPDLGFHTRLGGHLGEYGGKARRGDLPPSGCLGEYGARRGDAILIH